MFPPISSSSSLSSSSKSIFPKFSSISFAASYMLVFFMSLPPKYFFDIFICFWISSSVGSYSFKVGAAKPRSTQQSADIIALL
jgi:hypothetical protein